MVNYARMTVEFVVNSLTQPIQGSEFMLTVIPGPIDPRMSYARGSSLTSLKADQTGAFTLHARDEFGNARFGQQDDSQAFQVRWPLVPDAHCSCTCPSPGLTPWWWSCRCGCSGTAKAQTC